MEKNLFEQYRLNKRSMNSLRGGTSIICHSLQALANNKDVTAHWTSKDWDAWADQWEKNAC